MAFSISAKAPACADDNLCGVEVNRFFLLGPPLQQAYAGAVRLQFKNLCGGLLFPRLKQAGGRADNCGFTQAALGLEGRAAVYHALGRHSAVLQREGDGIGLHACARGRCGGRSRGPAVFRGFRQNQLGAQFPDQRGDGGKIG